MNAGNEWADLFGAEDEAMCDYLHPDISASCDVFLEGGLTGSTTLQRSFEGATVQSVEVEGETAYAESGKQGCSVVPPRIEGEDHRDDDGQRLDGPARQRNHRCH